MKFTEIAGAISEAILGTLDQETVEDPLYIGCRWEFSEIKKMQTG